MGYRSDVAYTIRFVPRHVLHLDAENLNEEEDAKKAKESFYTFLAEAKANEDTANCFNEEEPINQCEGKEGFRVDEEKCTINFFAQGVKWYPDYTDVKCHNALISLARDWEEENRYIGVVFAIVGEDLEDIEEYTIGQGDFDWLSIERRVTGDFL